MRRILLVLLSGIVLGAFACGGGVTPGEYLAEMESLHARLEDQRTVQLTELEAIHQEGDPFTEKERTEHDRERILSIVNWTRELSLELEDVEPTKQAKEAHEAYIRAIEGVAAAYEAKVADGTYHELFSPPHRPAAHRTLAQNEDSILSSDYPSIREAINNFKNACAELLESAIYDRSDYNRDGVLNSPCGT